MPARTIPPVIHADLSGKVVVVIGANTGLGYEASKHFATMNPAALILGCRSEEKGIAAVKNIQDATGNTNVKLHVLDLTSFTSVKAFAEVLNKEYERIDILVENAAVCTMGNTITEDGWEETWQVNDIALELLALLLLPKMIKTADQFNTKPRLVVVSSGAHKYSKLDNALLDQPNIHKALLKDESELNVMGRYSDQKLLNVFFARGLYERLPTSSPTIIVNSLCPGNSHSDAGRHLTGEMAETFAAFKKDAHTTEEGSRNLIYASAGEGDGELLNGKYITYCVVEDVGEFVTSEDGAKFQKALWDDMVKNLSEVDGRIPGIVEKYLK